jgi:carboxymethylenebutenolidase
MAEMVEFPSNGSTARGHLATPPSGSGPGVIVVQEWWGLDPGIKTVADKLAGEGFVALAPDLYHGDLAAHDEMDKAAQLMGALPMDRAARDMGSAVDYLRGHDATTGDKVGVVGMCMGGMLSWVLGTLRPDGVGAIVAYYGAPLDPSNEPDWSALQAPVLAHAAESDDFFPPDAQEALAQRLRGMGKDVTVHVYPGTAHAFASEHNALGTHNDDAQELAWERTLPFLRQHLG